MVLNIIDNALESITKVMDNFKGWIIDNSTNPVLYIGLFFIGIFIFVATYKALNK